MSGICEVNVNGCIKFFWESQRTIRTRYSEHRVHIKYGRSTDHVLRLGNSVDIFYWKLFIHGPLEAYENFGMIKGVNWTNTNETDTINLVIQFTIITG